MHNGRHFFLRIWADVEAFYSLKSSAGKKC